MSNGGTYKKSSFCNVGACDSVVWLLRFYELLDDGWGPISRDFAASFAEELKTWEKAKGQEMREALYDPAARMLADELLRQRRTGLSKDYVSARVVTSMPKGHILMGDTMRLRMRGRAEACCQVDEFVEDTYDNRVIKRTVEMLLKLHGKASHEGGISKEQLRRLKLVRPLLERVQSLEGNKVDWSRISRKKDRPYRILMTLCALVLSENEGYSLQKAAKDPNKSYEMFEKGVRGYLKIWHSDLSPRADTFCRSESGTFDNEGPRKYMPYRKPNMCTDITLKHRQNEKVTNVMVVDTKLYAYKNAFEEPDYASAIERANGRPLERVPATANLFQLFTYVSYATHVHKLSNSDVSGVLLFGCDVSWSMAWNELGHPICVRSLNLAEGVASLEKQLDELADAVRNARSKQDGFFTERLEQLNNPPSWRKWVKSKGKRSRSRDVL